MKFLTKLLSISLLFLTIKCFSIPTRVWVGQKDDKIVLLFGDHHNYGEEAEEGNYNFDKEYLAPQLRNIVKLLAKSENPINFVLEHNGECEKINSFLISIYEDPSKNCNDSLSELRYLSCKSKKNKTGNLFFLNSDIRPQLSIDVAKVFQIIEKERDFVGISNSIIENYTFCNYVKIFKDIRDKLIKSYIDEIFPKISDDGNQCISAVLEQINKNLTEFEANCVTAMFNKFFPARKMELLLFLGLLSLKSNDCALEIISKFDLEKKGRDKLIVEFLKKKESIDINKIIENELEMWCKLADLGFLKDILLSVQKNSLTLGYFGDFHTQFLIKYLEIEGFKKVDSINIMDGDSEEYPKKFYDICNNVCDTQSFVDDEEEEAIEISESREVQEADESKDPVKVEENCANCKKSKKELGNHLKQCSGCKKAVYCSRDCQVAHWKTHKATCRRKA